MINTFYSFSSLHQHYLYRVLAGLQLANISSTEEQLNAAHSSRQNSSWTALVVSVMSFNTLKGLCVMFEVIYELKSTSSFINKSSLVFKILLLRKAPWEKNLIFEGVLIEQRKQHKTINTQLTHTHSHTACHLARTNSSGSIIKHSMATAMYDNNSNNNNKK